jgi:hypothetical protein
MTDRDIPFGKLSVVWGAVAVITLFPLSFILLSSMAKFNPFSRAFYTLFTIYLIAQIFNRIPIGYFWINDLQSNLERLLFLISFSASVYLVLHPFGLPSLFTKLILVIAAIGILIAFMSMLTQRREEFPLKNRLVGSFAGLICILPMPTFIYLNQWPLQP